MYTECFTQFKTFKFTNSCKSVALWEIGTEPDNFPESCRSAASYLHGHKKMLDKETECKKKIKKKI